MWFCVSFFECGFAFLFFKWFCVSFFEYICTLLHPSSSSIKYCSVITWMFLLTEFPNSLFVIEWNDTMQHWLICRFNHEEAPCFNTGKNRTVYRCPCLCYSVDINPEVNFAWRLNFRKHILLHRSTTPLMSFNISLLPESSFPSGLLFPPFRPMSWVWIVCSKLPGTFRRGFSFLP